MLLLLSRPLWLIPSALPKRNSEAGSGPEKENEHPSPDVPLGDLMLITLYLQRQRRHQPRTCKTTTAMMKLICSLHSCPQHCPQYQWLLCLSCHPLQLCCPGNS
jgi:hypothetical protein